MKPLVLLLATVFSIPVAHAQYAVSASGSTTAAAEINGKPNFQTGSGAPSANCTAGKDFYFDTSGLLEYFCSATNTWKLLRSDLGITNAKTATYQVLAADFTDRKVIPVASGTFTITLVASGSQPANGQFIYILNYGSGVVTIARSGQNLNGGTTSLTLPAGSATAPSAAKVTSDGTDYFVMLMEVPSATTCTNQFVRATGGTAASTCATVSLTADVTGALPVVNQAAATLASGTSVSLTAPRQYYVCTGTCTVTPPVPAAGYEFCVLNGDNVATAITLAALGSSAMYENSARTAYGTAGTGTLVVSAAAANKVCIVGLDSTHYLTANYNGTVTVN